MANPISELGFFLVDSCLNARDIIMRVGLFILESGLPHVLRFCSVLYILLDLLCIFPQWATAGAEQPPSVSIKVDIVEMRFKSYFV